MRIKSVVVFMSFMISAFTIIVLINNAFSADPPPPQYPGAYPVELKVGEIFVVNKAVGIISPARSPICDDLKIVNVVDTPDGLAFKGISPGKTLCSVASGTTMGGGIGRRVFSITVHP